MKIKTGFTTHIKKIFFSKNIKKERKRETNKEDKELETKVGKVERLKREKEKKIEGKKKIDRKR